MSAALNLPPASPSTRRGFAMLDVEYLRRVRPLLRDAESRVDEAVVMECDGWDRTTTAGVVAEITHLRPETVRRAMTRLEQLRLIRSSWVAARTSPHGQRRIQVIRHYDAPSSMLESEARQGAGGSRLDTHRSQDSRSYDHKTHDRTITSLLTRSPRSEPDPSLPPRAKRLPRNEGVAVENEGTNVDELLEPKDDSTPGPASTPDTAAEGLCTDVVSAPTAPDPSQSPSPLGSETDQRQDLMAPESDTRHDVAAASTPAAPVETTHAHDVPTELLNLARSLWGTDVTYKAARRYTGTLLAIGEPKATAGEVATYLRASAKSARVQRARFPIGAACMPEEFADWLVRYRRMRQGAQVARAGHNGRPPPLESTPTALTGRELALRAKAFCQRLATPAAATEAQPAERAGELRRAKRLEGSAHG